MTNKATYRIRNWTEYNRSLINRGSITFWFSDDHTKSWLSDGGKHSRGRPQVYSDVALECIVLIRSVFHLPLRGLQGFVESLIKRSDLGLPCPNYTTVCKRAKQLKIDLPRHIKPGENIHVLVDGTGLKVYGEGEWKTKKHGTSKRRTWRKLHVAICAESQYLLSGVVTTNSVSDSEVLGELLDGIEGPIGSVTGDGAYDTMACYDECKERGAKPIIPPRRGGRKSRNNDPNRKARDEALDRIAELGGDDEARKKWKQENCYHKRSLVETYFFRFKTIFGGNLRSRTFANQATEVFAKCAALNKMTQLGMPQSYRID